MPQDFSKLKLSGSTDGKAIKLSQTATPGNLLHTASATALDEVWVWFVNSTAGAAVKVTVEWGEVTSPDGHIEVSIPGESGLLLAIPGLLLTNSLVVRAYAATTNIIMAHGFVNRVTG